MKSAAFTLAVLLAAPLLAQERDMQITAYASRVEMQGEDDFDGGLHTGWHLLMDAVVNYLGRDSFANTAYVDRGMSMVDLVDVLDGMRCRGHLTQANSEDLLHEAMGFDYDYMGPSSCP